MNTQITLCWWCGGKLVNGRYIKKVINGSERILHLNCVEIISTTEMDDDQWIKPRSYIETLNRRFYDAPEC